MQDISAKEFLDQALKFAASAKSLASAHSAKDEHPKIATAQQHPKIAPDNTSSSAPNDITCWLIDARSPKEFNDAHLVAAQNFYALDDSEHHAVGELYARDKWSAKALGASLICKNASAHIRQICKSSRAHNCEIFITCARGGQRSGSLGHIFSEIGFSVFRASGGMKALRSEAISRLANFSDTRFVALAGLSACGKTRLLKKLPNALDLEALAQHLGSTFGSRAQPQPSQQQFDFSLLARLYELSSARKIFIEAESKNIGRITLSNAFYEAMNAGIIVECTASLDVRISNCVADYRSISAEFFYACLKRLEKYLGSARAGQIAAFYAANNLEDVARELLVNYYDKVYRQSAKAHMQLDCDDLDAAAAKLCELFN